ncbi:hypothetical protein CRYUN_Cryun15aG0153400 [Craigia yunnanensis]
MQGNILEKEKSHLLNNGRTVVKEETCKNDKEKRAKEHMKVVEKLKHHISPDAVSKKQQRVVSKCNMSEDEMVMWEKLLGKEEVKEKTEKHKGIAVKGRSKLQGTLLPSLFNFTLALVLFPSSFGRVVVVCSFRLSTQMDHISDENNPNFIKPIHFQRRGAVMGSRKFGQEIRHNRRALSAINQNLVGAKVYPCVVNKRSLSERNENFENNQLDPVHRPITRKCALQSSSSRRHCPEESKKLKPSVSSSNEFGDCIFIDVEENKASLDQPVPMFLEETETWLSEADEMEEVEMEDIVEEPIVDIDGCDAKNPLAIVEYVEDLYAYYRKMENFSRVSPNYMAQQSDINEKMRAILIDWLIEVHDKFDLMGETLFLTVNLIDRFLSRQTVVRKKLQLVGLVAMLLACKYEEVFPVVGDLILISDKAYSRKEVLEMESLMFNTLQFNMSFPTPYVFMRRFLKAAQSDKKLELLSFFLIELALVEYEMLKFQPSLLAAAAVAQCSLHGLKQWSRTCEWHSSYSEDQLSECSRLMVGFHEKAATGKLTGVHRKYCTSKFGYTAKSEPAKFILETLTQPMERNV